MDTNILDIQISISVKYSIISNNKGRHVNLYDVSGTHKTVSGWLSR